MNEINWNRVKMNFRTKYNFELQDEDQDLYLQYSSKYPKGPICFVVFGALVLIFIVVGILLEELPMDKYTFVPFGVVFFLVLMSVNDMTKKMETIDKQLIEAIKSRRGSSFQGPAVQNMPTQNFQSANILKPKPASICPVCGNTIPFKAEIYNHCGQPLIWESDKKIMNQ